LAESQRQTEESLRQTIEAMRKTNEALRETNEAVGKLCDKVDDLISDWFPDARASDVEEDLADSVHEKLLQQGYEVGHFVLSALLEPKSSKDRAVEWGAIISCRHPSAPATLSLRLVEAKTRVRDEDLSRLEMRVNRTDKILGEVLQRDRDGRPSQGVRVRFRERACDLLNTVLGGEYEEVLLIPALGFFYASVSRRLEERALAKGFVTVRINSSIITSVSIPCRREGAE
jgi:hypothetical protein